MPLPERDFNQELKKTRGAAHALEDAMGALCQNDRLVSDKSDPSIQGLLALTQVLADRLDDLCFMNTDSSPGRIVRASALRKVS